MDVTVNAKQLHRFTFLGGSHSSSQLQWVQPKVKSLRSTQKMKAKLCCIVSWLTLSCLNHHLQQTCITHTLGSLFSRQLHIYQNNMNLKQHKNLNLFYQNSFFLNISKKVKYEYNKIQKMPRKVEAHKLIHLENPLFSFLEELLTCLSYSK